ncbi:MAG TPA: cytochrome c [Rhodospirillales bacterium]|nr:cytochrome c [Rhodospirillales bacterium]
MRSSTARKNTRPVRKTLALACLLIPTTTYSADIATERRQELLYLLKHDCGSCHGMTRKGGLGPALLSSILAAKSDETLATIILDGVPGTPMPPWRPFINPDEAKWLVQVLRQRKDNQ